LLNESFLGFDKYLLSYKFDETTVSSKYQTVASSISAAIIECLADESSSLKWNPDNSISPTPSFHSTRRSLLSYI